MVLVLHLAAIQLLALQQLVHQLRIRLARLQRPQLAIQTAQPHQLTLVVT